MGPLQLSDHVVHVVHVVGNDKQSHQIWIFFVLDVPVRHFLSSLAILYHVIAQLQRAYTS